MLKYISILFLLSFVSFYSYTDNDVNVLPEISEGIDQNRGATKRNDKNTDENNGDPSTDKDRYNKEVFTDFEVTTVVYGHNTTQSGVTKDLDMDIFTPKGDTETKRPLVILAHGGGFYQGSKKQFKNLGLAQMLSKSGYVVALISYRLIDIDVNTNTRVIGIIHAIGDMKAAVRYFRKDNAEKNKYKIDPNTIFVGGYSAGAITALHLGYINSDIELQNANPVLATLFNTNGGLEGNSGNPGFSSHVKGVINIAGAIVNTDFIKKGDPIIYSIHGTADTVVPFEGIPGKLLGSAPIHRKAEKEGLVHTLNAIEKTKHDVIFKCQTCNTGIRDFLFKNL